MRRALMLIAATAVLATAFVATSVADSKKLHDRKGETRALRNNPELDLVTAVAGHTRSGLLRHVSRVAGRLRPNKLLTRPFLVINTRGPNRGKGEYVILGRRIYKRIPRRNKPDDYDRVATARFGFNRERRAYHWRFDPADIGSEGKAYGWLTRTRKGRIGDQIPRARFQVHRP